MKRLLLLLYILFCTTAFSQIATFPYSETFSNTDPLDFTSTSNSWDLSNTLSARTGLYSAGLTPDIANNTKYIYIKILVQSGYTYTLSFWTSKICTVVINANETADQSTLLSTSTNGISGCNGKAWKESVFIYTPAYSGNMYFQILAPEISEDNIYIDDILITEEPPVALPITLLYFDGESFDHYNRLTWSTASESNNEYFLIEKTMDGIEFGQLCRVEGAGNSTTQLFYEAYDMFVIDGIAYYRLKQVDYNGEETTFDIISVDNRCNKGPAILKITNIMGQEVKGINPRELLIFHYEDGTVEKRYFTE